MLRLITTLCCESKTGKSKRICPFFMLWPIFLHRRRTEVFCQTLVHKSLWCPEAKPLSALRRVRNTLSVKEPLRVNFSIQNWDWKRGGFCKRKAPFGNGRHALSRKTSQWEIFLLSVLLIRKIITFILFCRSLLALTSECVSLSVAACWNYNFAPNLNAILCPASSWCRQKSSTG